MGDDIGERLGSGEVHGIPGEGQGGRPVGRFAQLTLELGHPGQARPGHGLVGGDDDPDKPGLVVQRLQYRHPDHGGAVGIGHDPAGHAGQRIDVHLRDDERDLGIHPPRRGVVDDDGPTLCESGRQLARSGRADGEEGEVDPGRIGGGDVLHHDLPAPELEPATGRPVRREQTDVIGGEVALMEDGAHHGTDLPRRPHDGHPHWDESTGSPELEGYVQCPHGILRRLRSHHTRDPDGRRRDHLDVDACRRQGLEREGGDPGVGLHPRTDQ